MIEYIGNRYIPKHCGAWDTTKNTEYESLSVVYYGGKSYTSCKPVPQGTDILNTEYWVESFDYNEQYQLLKEKVDSFNLSNVSKITTIEDNINALHEHAQTHDTAITENNVSIENNRQSIETLKTSINNLSGDVTSINNKISNIDTINSDLSNITTDYNNYKVSNDENIDKILEKINNLKTNDISKAKDDILKLFSINKNKKIYNIKDYTSDSNITSALKKIIGEAERGSTIYFPPDTYTVDDEIVINKPLNLIGSIADDVGYCTLNFNINSTSEKSAIRILNGVHGVSISNLYLINTNKATNVDGITIDGKSDKIYNDLVWYTRLNKVWVSKFKDNFSIKYTCLTAINECRSIAPQQNGFISVGFATGLYFSKCYSHQATTMCGFSIDTAYYSQLENCYSDECYYAYSINHSNGVLIHNCGVEQSVKYSVISQNSFIVIDGLTGVECGHLQNSAYEPTMVYVSGGIANIKNVSEERIVSGTIRKFTILGESNSILHVDTFNEKLDIYIPYNGKSSINGKFITNGLPSATGWTEKERLQMCYLSNPISTAIQLNGSNITGTLIGYQRLTTGNGNELNTDWLPIYVLNSLPPTSTTPTPPTTSTTP